MDLNKPATVKQVMLIVWGPALVAAVVGLVVIALATGRAQNRADADFQRQAALRDQAARDVLNETAPLGTTGARR